MQLSLSTQCLAVVLSCLFVAPPVWAEQHVASQDALDRALASRTEQERADRDIIRSVLQHELVRHAAGRAGVDVAELEAGVSTLEGAELQRIAQQARDADRALAGGAQTITISVTTLIIVVLLVLLIIAIA